MGIERPQLESHLVTGQTTGLVEQPVGPSDKKDLFFPALEEDAM